MRNIERYSKIPFKGALCDLVWSDFEDIESWACSPRGAGWLFGHRVTKEFIDINGLALICRAHQLVNDGIKFVFDDKLVTIWSAPNYCYHCGNMAAILHFKTVQESSWLYPTHSVSYRNGILYLTLCDLLKPMGY